MDQAATMMVEAFDAEFCSLHVRVSNRAALGLYRDVLKFEVCRTAPSRRNISLSLAPAQILVLVLVV